METKLLAEEYQKLQIIRGYIINKIEFPGVDRTLKYLQDSYELNEKKYGIQMAITLLEKNLNSFSTSEIDGIYNKNRKILNCFFETISAPYDKVFPDMINTLNENNDIMFIQKREGVQYKIKYEGLIANKPKYSIFIYSNETHKEKQLITPISEGRNISLFTKDNVLNIFLDQDVVSKDSRTSFLQENMPKYLEMQREHMIETLYGEGTLSSIKEAKISLEEKIERALNHGETVI